MGAPQKLLKHCVTELSLLQDIYNFKVLNSTMIQSTCDSCGTGQCSKSVTFETGSDTVIRRLLLILIRRADKRGEAIGLSVITSCHVG